LSVRALFKDDIRQLSTVVKLSKNGSVIQNSLTAANVPRFVHGFFAVPDITHNGGYCWKVVFKTFTEVDKYV